MQTVARLINSFIPDGYNLSVVLERQQRTFSGTVSITGNSTGDTIKLHAKDLTINDVVVDGRRAESAHGDNDELTITQDGLAAGKHIVVLGFSGTITDAMHGLYPCYFEHDGETKELLATQFESHHAREVFPCVDEPEAKATFDVSLTTEPDVTVLGNMPVFHAGQEDGKLVTTFDTTPRMSSYLLAWVIGDMQRKSATTKDGVEVNIWATPAQPAASLDFALDIATRTIEFFDNYFGVPYPLPKSDHVALPDFSSGAMENWGLITYREIALLADPVTTSISTKRHIATVITHELSHQWFGNLVTMKWWNNLWLNESFATLMEYVAVDALHPEWDIWLDFASSEVIMALRRDAIDGVQAVQVDVNHPDEINTLFDGAIVYAKGARLLRMLQTYIGNDAFQAGLRAYFSQFAYQNTEADDLWSCLAESSGKDVGQLMHGWLSQPGYPLVSVEKHGDTLSLSQTQFFVGPYTESERQWPIPLGATWAELPDTLNDSQVTVQTNDSDNILRLNDGDNAHFITRYDDVLLNEITDSIKSGQQTPQTRLQILHEQTMLARSGVVSSASIIPLLRAYENETADAVWDIIGLALGELKKFVENDIPTEQKLRALAGRLATQQFARLGWDAIDGEPENDSKLRSTILSLMLYSENQAVIDEALQRFNSSSLEDLDAEQRSLIIANAVRYSSDAKVVTVLIERYKLSNSADLRQDIASGLSASKDPEIIRQLLVNMTDKSTVRTQDVAFWFVYLVRSRDGRVPAWQWLRDNWPWIESTYGGDKSFDDYPRYAASGLVTRTQLNEYRDFFTPLLDIPALSRVIRIGLGEIEGRVDTIERDATTVRRALLELE